MKAKAVLSAFSRFFNPLSYNPFSTFTFTRFAPLKTFSKMTFNANLNADENCLFCRIIKGNIPALKVYEDDKVLAFLDIYPLSKGHILVIPKFHGQFLHQIPDEYLVAVLPAVKRIASVFHSKEDVGAYNLLQNNGKLAHQEIPHVHFHVIPKSNDKDGLGVKWNVLSSLTRENLEELQKDILHRLSQV